MADNDNGAAGLLIAFAVGAIVGAAVALLYAPASGEETRDYLGQRAKEGRDRARQNLSTAFEKAREQYERARDQYQSTMRGQEPEA
jgi:gas vesicle protein